MSTSYEPGTLLLLSSLAAVIPAAAYMTLIYWFDRYEKEPFWLLAAMFFWGAVPSVLLAIAFNSIVSVPFDLIAGPEIRNTLAAIIIAPPLEETVKGIALLGIFAFVRHEIDSLLDGIIYGAMVGMGFAMVENVFYFLDVYEEGGRSAWQTLIFMRAIVFGLNHSLFTSMTGLGLAVSRFATRPGLRVLAPILGWMVAISLHTIHNLGASLGAPYCLILPISNWGGILLLGLIIIWALLQERQWIHTYLKDEVALGTLTVSQYEIACSGRARLAHRLELLRTQGPRAYLAATRFYRKCSELAYKKHHYELLEEPHVMGMTQELREKLNRLSHQL
ncbi:MAG TPA: PrsW family intramembrane metalloprotease [Candidatus Sulfomarinibacteraceae bacterium]|nr:PrsW family intramembrane metalloprotease [Candidatus Sulfomarinibacteraceae bacterium]